MTFEIISKAFFFLSFTLLERHEGRRRRVLPFPLLMMVCLIHSFRFDWLTDWLIETQLSNRRRRRRQQQQDFSHCYSVCVVSIRVSDLKGSRSSREWRKKCYHLNRDRFEAYDYYNHFTLETSVVQQKSQLLVTYFFFHSDVFFMFFPFPPFSFYQSPTYPPAHQIPIPPMAIPHKSIMIFFCSVQKIAAQKRKEREREREKAGKGINKQTKCRLIE